MSLEKSNGRNEPLIIKIPEESYDVIMETLYMDLESSSIDAEIKEDINDAIESIDFLSDYERELLGNVAIAREEDKHVFGTDKVDPEDMPTCGGCGGQKEHPTKEFSSVPDNGLCAMELDECEPLTDLFDEMSEHYGEHGLPVKCNEKMTEYYEGEPCPFCEKDYDEYGDNAQFFNHSEGGGSAGDSEHYYSCPHCEKTWVNISYHKTQEVK